MQAGQLFISGFTGTEVPLSVKKLVLDYNLAGVVLFSRNFSSKEQLIALIAKLKEMKKSVSNEPLIVSVDYEGGFVQRFRKIIPDIISPAAISEGGGESLEIIYGFMAQSLRAIGINLCFSPVLDICSKDEDYIGIRSFGNLKDVLKLGSLAVKIFKEMGVCACGKHYPGLGTTKKDSHLTLPVSKSSLREIKSTNLKPFKEAIGAGVDCIMTAHCIFSALDNKEAATFSNYINTKILREELKFSGILISDDLEMQGAGGVEELYNSAKKAFSAGVDLMLACHSPDKLLEVVKDMEKKKDFYNKFDRIKEKRVERFHKKIRENEARSIFPQITKDDFLRESLNVSKKAIKVYKGKIVNDDQGEDFDILLFSESYALSQVEEAFKVNYKEIVKYKNAVSISKLSDYDFSHLRIIALVGDLTDEELISFKKAVDIGLKIQKTVLIKNMNHLLFFKSISVEVISIKGWTIHNQLALSDLLKK